MAKASELAISGLREAWTVLNSFSKQLPEWHRQHDHRCTVCGFIFPVCTAGYLVDREPILKAMRLMVYAVDVMRQARKGVV
jgi:hypothetical protein